MGTDRHNPQGDHDATRLLARLADGDDSAADSLMPLVYGELRALAQHFFNLERMNHTLEPTALVHEAFIKLVEQDKGSYQNKAHFMAMAATAMRRILTDYARKHRAIKRGRDRQRVPLTNLALSDGTVDIDIVQLDDLLNTLATLDNRQHRIVELRFFSGLTVDQVSDYMDLSVSTVEREWRMARAWLSAELKRSEDS
ncbi:MAG: ECF-type sigma factor [Planctomycetota bacterium]|jgi:RNA polymerase sigma factor (TIGR02999 family)